MRSIFSTYSQGENVVTETIFTVLQHLPFWAVNQILTSLIEEEDKNLFSFMPQVRNRPEQGSVYDYYISANISIGVETKIVCDSIVEDQIQRHIEGFKNEKGDKCVLVLTPCERDKENILEIQNNTNVKLIHKTFYDLKETISEVLANEYVCSDTMFLVSNLYKLFEEKGLLPVKDQVVVVPARLAWNEYLQWGEDSFYSAYICQPNRYFRDVDYIAFYHEGVVKNKIAKIYNFVEEIGYGERDNIPNEFPDDIEKYLSGILDNEDIWEDRTRNKIMILSSEKNENTVKLDNDIVNECVNREGDRPVAYVQNQRYTTLQKLRNARSTTDL